MNKLFKQLADSVDKSSISLAEKLGFTFNGQIKNELFRGKEYERKIFVLDCQAL